VLGTYTTGNKVLAYADMRQYYIVDRVGMSVVYDPIVLGANRRPTGQGAWYAFWRTGADVSTLHRRARLRDPDLRGDRLMATTQSSKQAGDDKLAADKATATGSTQTDLGTPDAQVAVVPAAEGIPTTTEAIDPRTGRPRSWRACPPA
jgi:hypothetical protein